MASSCSSSWPRSSWSRSGSGRSASSSASASAVSRCSSCSTPRTLDERTFRLSAVIVAIAVAAAAVGFLSGEEEGSVAAGLIGLLLAFAAPVIILLRIFHSPRITVRLVLGALAIYLLLGLTYAYLYPVIGVLTGEPFFVQTEKAGSIDFVYFSYVTLTTVGYGDFTASTSAGRIFAVSEALTGQLYLVSAVALLVGNIGQTISRGDTPGDISIARSDVDRDDERCGRSSRSCGCELSPLDPGRKTSNSCVTLRAWLRVRRGNNSLLLRAEALGSSPEGFFVSRDDRGSADAPPMPRARAAAAPRGGSRRPGSTRRRSGRRAGRSPRTVAPSRRPRARRRSRPVVASGRRRAR